MPKPTISILGCGWLGLPLGRWLTEHGYRVLGSTTSAEKASVLKAAGIEPYVFTLAPEPSPSVPAFFASEVLVVTVPPSRRTGTAPSYRAQMQAVAAAAQAGGVQRLLFTSSTSVYPDLNRVVYEDDAGGSVGERGRRLLTVEDVLLRIPDVSTTIVRLAGLFGGDRHPGRFLAGRQGLTNGGAPVNMLHLDDAVGVLASLIERPARVGAFNACSDRHPTRRTFYTAAAQAAGLKPPSFADDRAIRFKVVSARRLQTEVGYAMHHPDPLTAVQALDARLGDDE